MRFDIVDQSTKPIQLNSRWDYIWIVQAMLFPVGIWLGIQGDDLIALFFLCVGWSPIVGAIFGLVRRG